MRIIHKTPNKQEVDKLETLTKYVNLTIINFVDDISHLQHDVAELFISEFGVNGSIDLNSLNKLARITSHYASSETFQKLANYQRKVQKLFSTWQSLRKEALECTNKEKLIISVIPAKLCFFYFHNGELCKAVVCLLDYLELIPDDALTMEAALRWLMYLGETELAEKKLKKWKMEKSSEDLFGATRMAISYLKKSDDRVDQLKKLIELRDRIKSDNIRSFPKYELSSYVAWLCSTLSNVHVGSALKGCEFPDRMSQVQEATSKAESIVRNRVPGLAAYQFDNSVNASIYPFLEEKRPGTNTDYIHLGSTIAWHFEMRREWALVNVSTAQTRDSMSAMILNLRIALKSASFFRILQMTNLVAYYTNLIEEIGCEKNAELMKVSCVNLLSSEPVIVRCSTPKELKIPSRAQTPVLGQKSNKLAQQTDYGNTTMGDLTDRIGELDLLAKQPFHPITRTCTCNVCMSYPLSSTFAAEYMMAYCIYSDFSQTSIKHFSVEFSSIRERGMVCQSMMHKDVTVRPRPNVIQNEIFGLCVIQWLTKKIDANEWADEETLDILKNGLKIVKYLQQRTTDLSLAVTQLGRQLEYPLNCNYSWMQPIVKKPRVKAGIENAVDLLRAVSPFGRRQKCETQLGNPPFDKQRFEEIRREMRYEMISYGHILYRDWRCRLFPYIGRTSEDPWEAAYAWAESTLIGSRNAIQCRLEKCRKGVVTISGSDRFKACVQGMPDDMTLVQIAMADNKQIYMIKLHADRDPVIMPIAHYTQAIELMDKFTFLLEEDERIAKYPGEMTPEEFWKRRKVVDARMMSFVDEVQKNFLDVAANLLMPSGKLGASATDLARRICKLSKGGLLPGEAKEMVYLSEMMDAKSWQKLILRFCEMRNVDEKFPSYLPTYHKESVDALEADRKAVPTPINTLKKYTYLVICPHLSQFCWERLPIFNEFPYVGRQVSIHSIFSQLEAMRSQEKQIPLQINVQNAYYVLDPENNLGETKKRMLEYIEKFEWEGTVGYAPNSTDITTALSKRDAFFYFGHGSGSSVMPRSLIKQSTCNAISMLMGCGSVRTIPQALGFDGKSALHDYAMAKCPLIVGCLWTVTDGEIDRFLMRMVDDCFQKTRSVTGIDKLRQLSEAMHEARSKAKLKYLTGAAVVMYGLPVVSKLRSAVEKENMPQTPTRSRQLSKNRTPSREVSTPLRVETAPNIQRQSEPVRLPEEPATPKRVAPMKQTVTPKQAATPKRREVAQNTASRVETAPKIQRQSEPVRLPEEPATPKRVAPLKQTVTPKQAATPKRREAAQNTASRVLKTPRQTKTFPEEFDENKEDSKRSSRKTKPVTSTVPETPSSAMTTRTTRSSARTPSRSRQY